MTNGTRTGDLTETPRYFYYDWDAVVEYARMVNGSVQLFNITGRGNLETKFVMMPTLLSLVA